MIDSSLSAVINQSIANDIQIADVNNDGYNDIIYSGYDSSRFGLFIDVYLLIMKELFLKDIKLVL